MRDLVHLEEDLEENAAGVSSDPLACVRRAFCGMLYADGAGVVFMSAEGLAKMTVIVTIFETAGLTASEKKTETMLLRTPDEAPCTSPLVIEAAGQRYGQKTQFLYLGGLIDKTAGPTRMGMLQSIQAGTVRYGGFPVRSEVAQAKGRGDGNPAVRVRNVDPRQRALR